MENCSEIKGFFTLPKKEQLKKIFVEKLTEVYFDSYDVELQPEEAEERYIEETADELLKEVMIRTNL